MTIDEFPEAPAGRPIWLMTLADLALLLVGFFVFIQASRHLDNQALARGIREGFGAQAVTPPAVTPPAVRDPMPVAAAGMLNFAPGSAALPASPAALIAWAGEATRDPRVTLKISGSVDGSATDVDPITGSCAVVSVDRAPAVAIALAAARAVPRGRVTIVTAPDNSHNGRRTVIISLGFAGDRQ